MASPVWNDMCRRAGDGFFIEVIKSSGWNENFLDHQL